jgi:hypothetical protein
MTLLVSDCFFDTDSLRQSLVRLRRSRQDLIVFQINHPQELEFNFRGTTTFRGLESASSVDIDTTALRRAYLERLAAFQRAVGEACRAARADLVPLRTDDALAPALRRYLMRRTRLATGRASGRGRGV